MDGHVGTSGSPRAKSPILENRNLGCQVVLENIRPMLPALRSRGYEASFYELGYNSWMTVPTVKLSIRAAHCQPVRLYPIDLSTVDLEVGYIITCLNSAA